MIILGKEECLSEIIGYVICLLGFVIFFFYMDILRVDCWFYLMLDICLLIGV